MGPRRYVGVYGQYSIEQSSACFVTPLAKCG